MIGCSGPFHVLEIVKDRDSAPPLTNYLWNNSKANSNFLTIKEIVWEKTLGINNFNCIMGQSNYKEIEKYSFEAQAYGIFYSH